MTACLECGFEPDTASHEYGCSYGRFRREGVYIISQYLCLDHEEGGYGEPCDPCINDAAQLAAVIEDAIWVRARVGGV